MDEEAFRRELAGLAVEISASPAPGRGGRMEELAAEARERHRHLAEVASNPPEEILGFLRLCIKYLLFDLEATRRENEHLRELGGPSEND